MRDDVCGSIYPPRYGNDAANPVDTAVCYQSVRPVNNTNYLQCEVTNKAIKDVLEGKRADITYTCDKPSSECQFQFWIDELESFYCQLSECQSTQEHVNGADRSIMKTSITCDKMNCSCFPNRLLCGLGSGPDLTEWFDSDDPQDGGPVGPGTLQCTEGTPRPGELPERTCSFSEKRMNEALIIPLFGDPDIQLSCPVAGECMYASAVPLPTAPSGSRFSTAFIVLMSVAAGVLVLGILGALYWARNQGNPDLQRMYATIEGAGESPGPAGEPEGHQGWRANMMDHHVPSQIMFRDITYVIDSPVGARGFPFGARPSVQLAGGESLPILNGIQGIAEAGEVLAVMGGSGAGKTTFLDILAKRNKKGIVTGDILVNGNFMDDNQYRSIIGYVDQEDTLLPTLTVYETVLFSAKLRLPSYMPMKEKEGRVMETLMELGILHIANRRIGTTGERGISGGEKRRVSIACELVTGPSILFLDEPTSGLDAFNAFNVIESLVNLARTYRRTVILTIHQPRSNIFALFDKLLLLAKGRVVYSGPAQEECRECFEEQGFVCPKGFNMADYLVDLTMHVAQENVGGTSGAASDTSISINGLASPNDSSRHVSPRPSKDTVSSDISTTTESGHNGSPPATEELRPLLPLPNENGGTIGRAAGYNLRLPNQTPLSSRRASVMPGTVREHLRVLVDGYSDSRIGEDIARVLHDAVQAATERAQGPLRNGQSEASLTSQVSRLLHTTSIVNSRQSGAGVGQQFLLLSQRTVKNLYRNPYLLVTHYLISVLVAFALGMLFYHLDLSLSGFQNRMGSLFFICAVFGFGCLSSMMVFAAERVVFVRERAGGYYSPGVYFVAKVLFDLIPLRTVPPLILGLISYNMIGLRADDSTFLLKFLLVLVLFNLAAASACLAISIVISDSAVATLVATLVILFEMLFGGMLLNKNGLGWLGRKVCEASFFNAGWEALMVNEVKGLMLLERKFGLEIKVPGALILQTFGLDANGYWKDVSRLVTMIAVFLAIGMVWLVAVVKERR
ncbi:hypothetical protein HKX48_002938 [Thoreauomyces humboldtii]|nr:hypothetical protein HKX48_002938 [Thoreauomyces humboldtii]